MNKVVRQSNFEFLRIIAMIGILLFHSLYHGTYTITNDVNLNNTYVQVMQICGEVGVNLFVLISGYFLSSKRNFSIKRILKIWGIMVFYSVCFYLFSVIINSQLISLKGLVKSFFPYYRRLWWFANTYLVLLLIAPLLSKLINHMNKKIYFIIIAIGFVVLSFIPTLTANTEYIQNRLYKLIWFAFLYLVAGYIREEHRAFRSKITVSLVLVALVVFTIAMTLVQQIGICSFPMFGKYVPYFYNMFYVPTFLISTCIFILVSNVKMNNCKIINTISSACFDVYLIHDYIPIRNILWNKVFVLGTFLNSWFFILASITTVVIVYIICTIIGLIRINTIERLWNALLEYISKLLSKEKNILYVIYRKYNNWLMS